MRDSGLYLRDILSALEAIEAFVEDMDFDSFRDDDKTTSAVIRKFEVIGEASKNVPDPIKAQYPSIPWKEMAGMRDRLIHFYFGIDYGLVWETIKNRIPAIKPLLSRILNDLEP
ncbi:MAG TPA: DUF86 domain-containing protein [Planctomycetes bacterium]|nr:DUF86 domain-containing protein [Planctomycetota bacterium]HIJ70320.1 DUF86 domain-containing protein [Planctomycetota bacterium]